MSHDNTEAALIFTLTIATLSAFSYGIYQLLCAATLPPVV